MDMSTRWIQELESMSFIQSKETRKALVNALDIPAVLLDLEDPEKPSTGRGTFSSSSTRLLRSVHIEGSTHCQGIEKQGEHQLGM
jgi:hypothetical protein